MSDDPFLQVQTEVINTLQTTRPLYSSYLRIRSLTTSSNNPELLQSRSELESTLADLRADLADLTESVRAVELDPYRYGLDLDEVERRRKFVEDVGREVDSMAGEVSKTLEPSTDTGAGAGASVLPNPAEFDTDGAERGGGEGDDYYAAFEQQRQVEMMEAQNEQLDGVYRTVGNLRLQADTMGRELEDQGVLLEDVDNLADRVGGKLAGGMKRIRTIVKRNEGECTSFMSDVRLVKYVEGKLIVV